MVVAVEAVYLLYVQIKCIYERDALHIFQLYLCQKIMQLMYLWYLTYFTLYDFGVFEEYMSDKNAQFVMHAILSYQKKPTWELLMKDIEFFNSTIFSFAF
jgi:hypothetical protein